MKVFVSMVERLTGRPVRVVDAADWPSLALDYPPPERPPALSTRSDWEVSLGQVSVSDRPDGGRDVSVSAMVGSRSREQVSVSLSLSSGFAADQQARAAEGRSPLDDPLLISVAGSLDAMKAGAKDFVIDMDPSSEGRAVLQIAQTNATAGFEAASDLLVNQQAFSVASSVAAAVNRPAPPTNFGFNDTRRRDADDLVNVDLSV